VIKVCGITSLKDANLSIDLGANALGFNFYPRSSRFIDFERAEEILNDLPEEVTAVAVVVVDSSNDPRSKDLDSDGREIDVSSKMTIQDPGSIRSVPERIDWIQIHGVRRKEELPELDKELVIAVSPEESSLFPDFKVIIDTSWGTGRVSDWNVLKGLNRQYILSGGLTPENVGEALVFLNPGGVDVCSGVESAPGEKDQKKLAEFLGTVRTFYGLKK
jgi:phosphoribosylanthranilate isomerase